MNRGRQRGRSESDKTNQTAKEQAIGKSGKRYEEIQGWKEMIALKTEGEGEERQGAIYRSAASERSSVRW